MNKILLFSSLLFLLSNNALSQNFNKEKKHLIAMSNDKSTNIFVDPIHKYQILTAKEYYDNYIIPEISD